MPRLAASEALRRANEEAERQRVAEEAARSRLALAERERWQSTLERDLRTCTRMLRRLEWTQGLPNGGSNAARLCTVIDFTQDYVAGPPPDSEFEPADGIGSCVWTRRRE